MGVCESIWTPFKVLSTGMSLLNVSEQLVPPLHWDFFKHSVYVSSFFVLLFFEYKMFNCRFVKLSSKLHCHLKVWGW